MVEMVEIRLMLLRKDFQPEVGKGSMCDFCSNQSDSRRSEEEELWPCKAVDTESDHPYEPNLVGLEGDYESCNGYIPLPLDEMLTTIELNFGVDNVEEYEGEKRMAKKYALHFGASMIAFWEQQKVGYTDAPHHEPELYRRSWEKMMIYAQKGDWSGIKTDIYHEGERMLIKKTEYPINGAIADELRVKGLDKNWRKFGDSLIRLAALLPSE